LLQDASKHLAGDNGTLSDGRTGQLTLAAYDEIGGIGRSVAKAAEDVLKSWGGMSSEQEPDLHHAFVSMVQVNEQSRFTRRPANWNQLPPQRTLCRINYLQICGILDGYWGGELRWFAMASSAIMGV
jgi:hypothetical protein